MYSMVVTLEVSKLSGWLNAAAPCQVRRKDKKRVTWRLGAARIEDPTVKVEGRARAVRTSNMPYMAATLDVSQLSGWLNALASCRVKREKLRERGDMQARRRESRGAAAALTACREDPIAEACWQGTRGAHEKHVLHACDAGRVEAQRLVERRRFLPSGKGSLGRGATCRPGGGVGWRRRKERASRTQLWRLRVGHARSTENMLYMFVTLEVSQLDMSALNWFKALKRSDMSVTAETPQLEMGPCVASADATSALYSWAAVRREALSVNVAGQFPGPQLEP